MYYFRFSKSPPQYIIARPAPYQLRTLSVPTPYDGLDWKTGLKYYVQNSSSPEGSILPPHLGHVCISHLWILSEPHLRQSLPTRELKLGAASPITPPTTRGTMFLQSAQDMASICCPMKPRPSYITVSYPHSWHLKIFFFDIIHLLLYLFLYFQSAILHKGSIRLR